jgi:hypothetical protein
MTTRSAPNHDGPEEAVTSGPTRAHNELTQIAGIGSHTAASLRDAGIDTIDKLASATVEQVVTACGLTVPTNARAQGWIEQASELADRIASGPAPEAPRPVLLPRRTFTIETQIDGDTNHVLTTQVVHLETQEAKGWSGWSRTELLDFLETRLGIADREPPPSASGPDGEERGSAGAESARAATAPPSGVNDASNPPSPTASLVHRFGLLRASTPLMGRGEMAARLRLDPAGLALPANRPAVAQVDLLAKPLGGGRTEILHTQVIALPAGGVIDTVLSARLPDRDPPFAVSAIIRVLVDQPSEPKEGLGNATFELIPRSDGPI